MQMGQVIAGKYRLNRPIGSGGMATVWSATNVFTEREFAIKFLLPQLAKTPEAARRFLLEAKVSARINHPNIIEIIDVGQTEDSSLFLVMELLTGQSLEVALRRQNPPMLVRDFVGFMLDVAHALAAAHKSGVIHRDLKPTNIFLHQDRDGTSVPKILDFGVSKILEEEQNNALTVAGTVLGSPLYMSPEQAMGASGLDGRSDIFSFGGIFFEALTGARTYDAPNFNALIVAIATTEPKSIDHFAPYMPQSLRTIVKDCLTHDKRRRAASFEVIAGQLANVLGELQESDLRLPPVLLPGPPSDPDATNVLPVIRAADKILPGPSSRPPPQPPPERKAYPMPGWQIALLVASAAILAAVIVVAIVVFTGGLAGSPSRPAKAAGSNDRTVPAASSEERRVVPFESLPVAPSGR